VQRHLGLRARTAPVRALAAALPARAGPVQRHPASPSAPVAPDRTAPQADGRSPAALVLDTHPVTVSEPPEETVQRQEATAAAPQPAATTGPPAPAAPAATAPAAGAPGAAQSPDQLEELARRLVGPLARRLKAEMLLDRERRGLRTDAR
jgi:hypothetical protein